LSFQAGEVPAVYRRQPPLLWGAETGKTDMPLTAGAQKNTAFSPLNKGGCPKDKGDLPASMSLRRLFLHTLREKALVTTEFTAHSGLVVHALIMISISFQSV